MFGLLAGGLLKIVPGLFSGFLEHLNKKTDADLEKFKTGVGADTTLNVEDIRARVELTKLAAEQRKLDREHWSTRWMLPTAFALCIFHFGAVVFDSIPLFGHKVGSWGIAALPGSIGTLQATIIAAVAGVSYGASTIKRIFTK